MFVYFYSPTFGQVLSHGEASCHQPIRPVKVTEAVQNSGLDCAIHGEVARVI